MTDQIAEIAASLSRKQRRNIIKTPCPQPLENVWLWPGSRVEAQELARMKILDQDGFTPLGLALREYLEKHNV